MQKQALGRKWSGALCGLQWREEVQSRLNWVGVSFPTHRRFGFASRLYVVNRPLSCSATGCAENGIVLVYSRMGVGTGVPRPNVVYLRGFH